MQWYLLKEGKWCLKHLKVIPFTKLKESEQSEQSSDDVKQNSFGHDIHKLSKKIKDVSLENILCDLNDTGNTE